MLAGLLTLTALGGAVHAVSRRWRPTPGVVTACSSGVPVDLPQDSVASPCVRPFEQEPGRTRRITERLQADPVALRWWTVARPFTMCFGPTGESSAVVADRLLLLRSDASDDELVGRVAHLVTHLAAPLSAPHAPCAAWLEEVHQKESIAHALENRLRNEHGLPEIPNAHVDQLMEDYATRCRDLN